MGSGTSKTRSQTPFSERFEQIRGWVSNALMKKSTAALVAGLLPCLAYGAVVVFTERVFWDTSIPPGKEQRAALAIRDNVTPFQKWGSRRFTWPYLDRYYDAAWYFTQADSQDHKQSFLSCLDDALQRYEQVDLYLLAHGNHYLVWVAELPAEHKAHLRLVYNTGCGDLEQGPQWLRQGAKAYVGHPGTSTSPVFYFYFLRRWSRGYTLRDAVAESNREMHAALRRAEFFSFGAVDAEKTMQESEANCHGDSQLRS